MTETVKTRPGTVIPGRATEPGQASRQAHTSNVDFTTSAAGRQTGISSLLMHGADHAIPLRHLKELTGLSDRDLRRRIQRERLSGIPILADNSSGYYLPADRTELDMFVRSMWSRSREIAAVAAAVEEAELRE